MKCVKLVNGQVVRASNTEAAAIVATGKGVYTTHSKARAQEKADARKAGK